MTLPRFTLRTLLAIVTVLCLGCSSRPTIDDALESQWRDSVNDRFAELIKQQDIAIEFRNAELKVNDEQNKAITSLNDAIKSINEAIGSHDKSLRVVIEKVNK